MTSADGDSRPRPKATSYLLTSRRREHRIGTACVAALGVLSLGFLAVATAGGMDGEQPRVVLVVLLVLAAIGWGCLVLAVERFVEWRPRRLLSAGALLGLVALLAAPLWLQISRADVEVWQVWAAVLFIQALLAVALWDLQPSRSHVSAVSGAVPARQRDELAQHPALPHVVAASGGGIRAAAFVLGGMQAVQQAASRLAAGSAGPHAPQSHQAGPQPVSEPVTVAVSGGSYVTAAAALVRTYTSRPGPDGTLLRGTPGNRPRLSWTRAYSSASPELGFLRRTTRYLFDPRSETLDGAIRLVIGAGVNLVVLAGLWRLIAWATALLAATTGLVTARTVGGDPGLEQESPRRADVAHLHLAQGFTLRDWLLVLAPALLLLALFAVLLLHSARRGRHLDDVGRLPSWRVLRGDVHPALRVGLVGAALGWIVVVVGIPAATVGLAHLSTTNSPTPTVAQVLSGAGFATSPLCQSALVESAQAAHARAEAEARLSPGEQRSAEAGACGLTTTVTLTTTAAASGGDPQPEVAEVPVFDAEAAAALWLQHDVPGGNGGLQVGTVTILLTAAIGLLRKISTFDPNENASWWRRVLRKIIAWLPLAIVVSIGAWVMALWTFEFLSRSDSLLSGWSIWLVLAAVVLALGVDANSTSMHGFYRRRLSAAFAVGRTGAGGTETAEQLPFHEVYAYSQLSSQSLGGSEADGPRLRVVTTMNVHAPGQTPAARGGLPLVFGPDTVRLSADHLGIAAPSTAAFEQFAGAGRVSVMGTVAMSGAAVSPLAGRFAPRLAPYRLLLALLNIRVGVWVRNPRHCPRAVQDVNRQRGWTQWLTSRPGIMQVATEAVGRSSIMDRWVYLSDGGHLDNTGLVEAVRLCQNEYSVAGSPARILVLDASNDADGSWSAIGNAVAVVRADLGVALERDQTWDALPWARCYAGAGQAVDGTLAAVEVIVVKAVRGEDDDPALESLPADVLAFRSLHPDFPRSSTTRQLFGDLEFEAYRALGTACAESVLKVIASRDGVSSA